MTHNQEQILANALMRKLNAIAEGDNELKVVKIEARRLRNNMRDGLITIGQVVNLMNLDDDVLRWELESWAETS